VGCGAAILAALTLTCAGLGAVLAAFQAPALALNVPMGYVVGVCVGTNASGRLALEWESPYLSARLWPPAVSTPALCGFSPWLPVLPPRGSLVLSP
jgi:hypothetical protein